ncbi:MAG: D-2-hydroxyacid dehydrogenase [Oscillospiraceae bacterium]|nr:D-2-hydroxyacid dehydrogenase [Oscillospiraceae bacterium]
MSYNISVICPAFDQTHIRKIRSTAESFGCHVDFYVGHEEALPHLTDTHILFAPSDARSPELVKAAPDLKWFASFYAGVDPLLAPDVLKEDILLTNGSGAYGVTIAEHLTMVTIMLMRRYPEYREIVANKGFRHDLPLRSIYGSTIVICGTGDIGSKFAQRLRPFCPAKVIGVNRTGRTAEGFDEIYTIEELDNVLPQADVLALTLPGTPLTTNLITRERLALMKQDAYLINIGRGSCLDQEALADALNSGSLAGAALDVFRTEPIPENDPIWDAKNLIITPHCSGQMTLGYTRDTLVDMFCENLTRFCQGQPLKHIIDRNLAY